MSIQRLLAATGVLLILTACTGAGATTAATTPAAGTTRPFEGFVIGNGFPTYSVEAPFTWTISDESNFVYADGPSGTPSALGMSVWDVGQVPSDPCNWRGTMQRPGATVDDIVAAFEAQKLRHATPPSDVTLDGHTGKYFEMTVPSDMHANNQSDFHGCDVRGNGHKDFISFLGDGAGERWEQVPGQVDRIWVIDVNGQPLLVDGTYSPDTSQAERQQLGDVINSIHFVTS